MEWRSRVVTPSIIAKRRISAILFGHLCLSLYVFSLMFMPRPALAAGIVSQSPAFTCIVMSRTCPTSSSSTTACHDLVKILNTLAAGMSSPATVVYVSDSPSPASCTYVYHYADGSSHVGTMSPAVCGLMTCGGNSFHSILVCPANSTNISGACNCDSGYAPDSTATHCEPVVTCPPPKEINPNNGQCESPCRPPDVIDPATGQCVKCAITLAPTEITDPVAKQYDDGTYNSTDKPDLIHLNQATLTGLACIVQKVNAINCYKTPRPTSGYRPTAYQKHIRDVYDNWMKIKDNNSPECAQKKIAAEAEFNEHKPFARRPGATSNHSQLDASGNPSGNAVDISGVPDNALDSADTIAAQCDMKRPLKDMPNPRDNDPIHYQPK